MGKGCGWDPRAQRCSRPSICISYLNAKCSGRATAFTWRSVSNPPLFDVPHLALESNYAHRLTGIIALFLRGCKEMHISLNVMGCCWFSASKCSDPLGASLLHQTRRGLITKLLCMLYSCQNPGKLDMCNDAWDGRRHCGKLHV